MNTYPQKPSVRPANPCFSSGPCAKRPGWSLDALAGYQPGRSHRAPFGVAKIKDVIEKSRAILDIPADYKIAVVPASDTGAIELAMWSLLGPRTVDVLGWEVFGKIWVADVVKHLKIPHRAMEADFGDLPDLSAVDTVNNDVIFTWNGTTAGVKVPNGDWIASDRKGLTFCDATSAVFAMDMPWDKLDVTTWSWQKVLGGEAAHGMLVLSPRAVERLETHTPAWPLPKIFRITKNGKLFDEPFEGKTLNTPSMIAVEDCLDALKWAENEGGLSALLKRSAANFKAACDWIDATDWCDHLANDPATRSNTSICFKVVDPWFLSLPEKEQLDIIKNVEKTLEADKIAYEVANHRDAPASFRIWGGATVETSDLAAVLPWIDYVYRTIKTEKQTKAA